MHSTSRSRTTFGVAYIYTINSREEVSASERPGLDTSAGRSTEPTFSLSLSPSLSFFHSFSLYLYISPSPRLTTVLGRRRRPRGEGGLPRGHRASECRRSYVVGRRFSHCDSDAKGRTVFVIVVVVVLSAPTAAVMAYYSQRESVSGSSFTGILSLSLRPCGLLTRSAMSSWKRFSGRGLTKLRAGLYVMPLTPMPTSTLLGM